MEHRRCSRCKTMKQAEAFTPANRYCRPCRNEYLAERRVRKVWPDHSVEKTCPECGVTKLRVEFYGHPQSRDRLQRVCKECAAAYHRRRRAAFTEEQWQADIERAREWQRQNPDRVRVIKARMELKRAAIKRGATVAETIDRHAVYRRDSGLCGICGDPVEPDRFHVDHIQPLARGGQHVYANVQIAHPRCNQRKQARIPEVVAA